MGLLVPGKRQQNRKFDYQPRFYNPERERKIRERIRIERRVTSRRRSPAGFIYAAILLLIAVYLYTSLS
jgi:hypothetical protein